MPIAVQPLILSQIVTSYFHQFLSTLSYPVSIAETHPLVAHEPNENSEGRNLRNRSSASSAPVAGTRLILLVAIEVSNNSILYNK
ncbi:hypothetical protein M9H77_02204 [Catharanthus roseus]|uniref:Uncharacterized protein n=1 Tax=Catharanthus roseus TaxID=4058 RepID=A0ACC0C7R1_CATRO|nr:hypothetical protein M9H77_02204 [Catharanthus roseus]